MKENSKCVCGHEAKVHGGYSSGYGGKDWCTKCKSCKGFRPAQPPKDDVLKPGAKDFAKKFGGIMKEWAEEDKKPDPKLSIVEEFRKKVSELSGAISYKEMGDESQVVDFGYWVLRGTETWKVVDFGNIEKFLTAALEAHGKADGPMGVSQWLEHGKKYGYETFFIEKAHDQGYQEASEKAGHHFIYEEIPAKEKISRCRFHRRGGESG